MNASEMCEWVFTIPPIQESIFGHGNLSCHGLANACLVSKAWLRMVSPFLWRTITLTSNCSQEWSKGFKLGLASHGQWIRTLTTTSDLVLNCISESSTCTRLSTINICRLNDNQPHLTPIQKIVSKNPKLQVLRWHAEQCVDYGQLGDVCKAMTTTSSTSLTTVDFARIVLPDSFYHLLTHHAATMKHLSLEKCYVFSDTTFAFKEHVLNLKTLTLEWNEYVENSELEFVECFKALIRMTKGLAEFTLATADPVLIRQLPELFTKSRVRKGRDGPFGLLESLTVKCSRAVSFVGEPMNELLDALPDSLSRLNLEGFSVGDIGNLALKNFASRNHDRLTSIKLLKCRTISSETWQMILTSCPYLKEVESTGSSCFDVAIGCKEPWVCLGLEQFKMSVEVDAGWLNDDGTFVLEDCENIFSQLAALTQLKRLNIVILGRRLNPTWANLAKKQFLLLWSKMQVCMYLREVRADIRFPNMRLDRKELQSLNRKIWGDNVKARIEV